MNRKVKRDPAPTKKKTARAPQHPPTGKQAKPVAQWIGQGEDRRLVLRNNFFRVELRPEKGGAIARYIDVASGIDVIWRNPYGLTRPQVLDQPMSGGSDLYDVMDGSWYVSLPNGFFAGNYFGAPLGTHGELRALPWAVESILEVGDKVSVILVGRSVRTPLIYRRELTVRRGSRLLHWRETVENRAATPLPIAWLHHPTFGGDLLDGAELVAPARTVSVFKADDPKSIQLKAGYRGRWPRVPEREGGGVRDCSVVPAAGSGKDHSVQLTDFDAGWGCIWNAGRRLGFAIEWELDKFPYAWSWASSGGIPHYPLWGEGHIITLQPSTSPVGRFDDLVKAGDVLQVPARGKISTVLKTGFVNRAKGPWEEALS